MSHNSVRDHMVVSFTYRILDQNGAVVEQSDLPIHYVHGVDDRIFPKIMQTLEGHVAGDEVDVHLGVDEAFGHPDPALTYTDDIDNVPPDYRHMGAEAMFENSQGETITMRVIRIADGKITLDGNHPLAGQAITFKIEIKDIREATKEEVGTGQVADGSVPGLLH